MQMTLPTCLIEARCVSIIVIERRGSAINIEQALILRLDRVPCSWTRYRVSAKYSSNLLHLVEYYCRAMLLI
jgi:hypothetical protein